VSATRAIWRSVVVAGAMLGTAHADTPSPKAPPPPKNAPVDQKSPNTGDRPVDKAPVDKAPVDKDPAKQKPAPNKPVDKKSTPKPTTTPTKKDDKDKKADASRPRGSDSDRPVGRGFVLA